MQMFHEPLPETDFWYVKPEFKPSLIPNDQFTPPGQISYLPGNSETPGMYTVEFDIRNSVTGQRQYIPPIPFELI